MITEFIAALLMVRPDELPGDGLVDRLPHPYLTPGAGRD